MELMLVEVEKPADINVIIGQSHFIKTVEDLHEVMVNAVPNATFGLAFCEASADRLVRTSGTDGDLVEMAARNAEAVGCGHTFFLFLKDCFPINVLGAIKACPEVCRIFCATANDVKAVVAEEGEGRGLLGVIDGLKPLGVETEADVTARKGLLRKFGYKQ